MTSPVVSLPRCLLSLRSLLLSLRSKITSPKPKITFKPGQHTCPDCCGSKYQRPQLFCTPSLLEYLQQRSGEIFRFGAGPRPVIYTDGKQKNQYLTAAEEIEYYEYYDNNNCRYHSESIKGVQIDAGNTILIHCESGTPAVEKEGQEDQEAEKKDSNWHSLCCLHQKFQVVGIYDPSCIQQRESGRLAPGAKFHHCPGRRIAGFWEAAP
jgi:hypothetical protein